MQLTQNFTNGIFELGIDGDMDANSAIIIDDFFKEALEENRVHFIIDCQTLRYISSAGLGVFISYLNDIQNKQGQMVFYNMSDSVFNVFEILGLHQVMAIVPNKEAALDRINEGKHYNEMQP